MANVPQDITDRLKRVERQLRDLTSAANKAPALDEIQRGDVVIGEGGQLRAETPDGKRVLAVGQTPREDWGTILGRQDGTQALAVGVDRTAHDAQMIRLFSRSGEAIVMDDPWADGYLGRPALPIPWQPTPGWTTASKAKSGTVSWYAATRIQCPVLHLITETHAPAGATASVVLECSTGDGYEEWETWTAVGGRAGAWTTHTVTRPMHGISHFTHVTWRIRHRVSKGAGRITTHVIGAYQRNTLAKDEVPKAPGEEGEGGEPK